MKGRNGQGVWPVVHGNKFDVNLNDERLDMCSENGTMEMYHIWNKRPGV